VIQHTWHPSKVEWLFKIERQVYAEQWRQWKEDYPIQVDSSHLLPDADGCPKCGSTTIRYRMRANTWICVHKPKGITCGHVFETPVRVVSYTAVKELEDAALKVVRFEFDDHYGIGLRVATIALQQHLQYISMVNTKTLCKRCAFVEDRTNMVLCTTCKKNYHSRSAPRCPACSGVDTSQRKAFYDFLNGKTVASSRNKE
jgi:ssDNA-binding Zn-finger/Zn-ribbon topoisomerase 1